MIPDFNRIYQGDNLATMRTWPDAFVNTVVTSPPYWGLRDYGVAPGVWGGAAEHAHEWGDEMVLHKGGPHGARSTLQDEGRGVFKAQADVKDVRAGAYCVCGAWRGALGLEPTPDLFVAHMVEIFREVHRVLRDDGTLWVNMGDSYAGSGKVPGGSDKQTSNHGDNIHIPTRGGKIGSVHGEDGHTSGVKPPPGLKPKDLVGVPWMLAFVLRADGWFLRQDIVWAKTNPMPESVSDRCTKAHEYLFLLSKSPRYYFDADEIKEKSSLLTNSHGRGVNPKCAGWAEGPGSHEAVDHAKPKKEYGRVDQDLKESSKFGRAPGWRVKQNESFAEATKGAVDFRNKRSVWTVNTEAFKESHFATFPQKLIEPCVLAGAPKGGLVLDPFMGAGTTGLVAARLQRNFLGCELNSEYVKMAEKRIAPELAQGKLFEQTETRRIWPRRIWP